MIGFNLLHDLKQTTDPSVKDELIAKAVDQLEAKAVDMSILVTKIDLHTMELRLSDRIDDRIRKEANRTLAYIGISLTIATLVIKLT